MSGTSREASPDVRSAAPALQPCPGCGLELPASEGPSHAYIGASPACWAVYGEVLAREFGDFRYGREHRLTVDAYAVQHPGVPSRRSIQSVALHLIGLHLRLERGWDPPRAARGLQRAVALAGEFVWLEPPEALPQVTVLDVRAAREPEAHLEAVRRWARCAWESRVAHHALVRRWAERALPVADTASAAGGAGREKGAGARWRTR